MIYKGNVLNFMLFAGWYGVRGQEGEVNKVCFFRKEQL